MYVDNAIVTRSLRKAFKKVSVLDGIDIEVRRGTVLALLGPNGAGKTTTVRILATLLKSDSGQAFVNGYDVAKQPDAVRGSIGLTGQYAAVDDLLTGYENLELMGRLYRLGRADAKRRAWQLIEQFDLVDAAGRIAKTYSGGMRRRLDLAASLVAAPPILFLDEPTSGLDPRSRATLWEMIQQLVRTGTTILLTTQYLEEADHLADRVAVLDNGTIIAEGTADELKQRVGSERAELVFATMADYEVALGTLAGETLEIDPERRVISAALDEGTRHLKSLLDRLEAARVESSSLTIRRPTLDDVFLTLTGHGAAPQTTDKESPVLAGTGKDRTP